VRVTLRVPSAYREYLFHAALVGMALAAIFPLVFLRGHMISSAYLLYDFAPWKAYGSPADFPHDKAILTWEFLGVFTGWYSLANRALSMGEWPLWNPYEHTGVPLLANYQSAVFYPPRLLHALINLHLASTLLILLKVWLCGFNAYIYARCTGLGKPASRLLSFGWMLATYNMVWTYWSLADVSAWFPLLLLGVEWALQERYRRAFFLIAASATLMLLAGHPETAFSMALGAGFYFLLRLVIVWPSMRFPWRAPAVCLGAWALALPVCAGQILPFLEYLRHSFTLAERAGQASSEHALSGLALVNVWVPRYFGMTHTPTGNYWGGWINSNFNTVIYPGIAVLLCILMLFSLRRGARNELRVRALCLAVPALICLLVVFDHPVTHFIKAVPVIGSMWNIWWFAFPAFAIPAIGALGLEHALASKRPFRDAAPAIAVAATALVACAALYLSFHRGIHILEKKGLDYYVQMQLGIAFVFALSAITILVLLIRWKSTRLANTLVALLVADLLYASHGIHPTAPLDRILPETKLTNWIQSQDPPPRFALGSASSATIPDGIMQFYGIEDFLGYDGIYPERVKVLREKVKLWNSIDPVFSVKYYLNLPALTLFVPEDQRKNFKLVETIDGLEVYENLRAWPRARLVPNARVLPDREAIFDVLDDRTFDPAQTVLLEENFEPPLPENTTNDIGTVRFAGRTMNTVRLEAQTTAPCALVLSDQYFPGWNAYINGETAPIHSAYYLFRAVQLAVGKQTIEFRYEPMSFRIGMAISIAAMFSGLAAALFCMRKHRGIGAINPSGRARWP